MLRRRDLLKSQNIRQDVIVGLTAAAIILPKAMAYAAIAGLSVETGLYTSIIPLLVYALLGTSQILSVTSTTTLAILTAAEIEMLGPNVNVLVATATLTFLVGVFLILASFLRLGFISSFISTPVLVGFKAGIGLVIVLDQVPKILGLHIGKQGFFFDLASVVRHLPEISWMTLAVSVASIMIFLFMQKMFPRSPVALVVVGAGILFSWIFNLKSLGVSTVGTVTAGLPALRWPEFSLVEAMIPGVFGLTLMSFTETIATARVFIKDSDPPIAANREMLATGLANLLGSFFGSMPSGGGASQTAFVRLMGGISQLTSFVVAGVAAAVLLFFSSVLSFLPHATLAVVVVIYSVSLIRVKEFNDIKKIRNMEFRWALIACLGVLLFGTLKGIIVAVVMSLIGLAGQAALPRVSVLARKRDTDILRPISHEHPEDETFEGLLILRPEGRIFFLNAETIANQIQTAIKTERPRVVLLDMSRVFDIEYSALKMLMDEDAKQFQRGQMQWIAAFNPDVWLVVRNAGWDAQLKGRLFHTPEMAIANYLKEKNTSMPEMHI
jgi:high affinity sulfate transporter 1